MIDQLTEAIDKKKAVRFMYDDRERVVEVHAIGKSTKDNALVMRGYQVGGKASRPLPQWSLFRLSSITSLKPLDQKSEAPRPGYAQGDRQMSEVLAEITL